MVQLPDEFVSGYVNADEERDRETEGQRDRETERDGGIEDRTRQDKA